MIRARDRRHDRAFDEAPATGVNGRGDLLLRGGRYRVEIDIEVIRGQVAGETCRCVVSR